MSATVEIAPPAVHAQDGLAMVSLLGSNVPASARFSSSADRA